MERIGEVVKAGSKARTLAVMVTATLAMGCCGGDHGNNPRVSSTLAPSSGSPELAGVFARGRPVRRYGADVPLAYYDLSFKLSKRTGGMTPPVQARTFAYMGLALYESLVAGMPEHRSIARRLHGIGELPRAHGRYHWPLVASAALAEVMRGLWGDATNVAAQNIADIDALEAEWEAAASEVPTAVRRRSIDFGHSVGAAVFETSKDDGEHRSYLTNVSPGYVPPVGPGLWVPLPGQMAIQPFWADRMTAFVSPASSCSPTPPAYSETPGSTFHDQALEVYQVSTHLTPEQLTIAHFWADGPASIGGPGHSLSTTSQVLVEVGANLEEAAEAFARVGIADADALLSCWSAKYEYDRIRPITYIRRVIDPAYTTPLPTPAFPEYSSAHSVQTAAALTTLQALFGDVGYTDHTHDADGFEPRTFASLTDSMNETGISRLYAGIHFRAAIVDGFTQGRCVAAKVNALPWRRGDHDRDEDAGN
jgi:hypothetical protein